MPNVVRFVLSSARTLDVPGAGTFYLGVLDVDANDLKLVARTRYRVQAYGAVEVGIVDSATPYPSLPSARSLVVPPYATRLGVPTVAALGDSITQNGNMPLDPVHQHPIPAYSQNGQHYMLWAQLLSGSRFRYIGAAATGGYTPAQIRAVHLPQVLAARPTYCVVLTGQNDPADLANIVGTWQDLLDAGIVPVICSLTANSTSLLHIKVNLTAALWAQRHGVPFVDIHKATVEPTDGSLKAAYAGDSIHPNEAGAKAMGQAVADVMTKVIPTSAVDGLLPQHNNDDVGQIGYNPIFLEDWSEPLQPLAPFTGTYSTVTGIPGRVFTLTSLNTGEGVGAMFLQTEIIAGHRYQIAAKIGANVESAGGWWSIRCLDATDGALDAFTGSLYRDVPMGTPYLAEFVAPTPVPHVSHRLDFGVGGAVGAQLSIAQVVVRDLTALGVA